MTENTAEIFQNEILAIFRSINDNISPFQYLLDQYIDFTSSQKNKEVVKNAISIFFAEKRRYLVPANYVDLFRTFSGMYVGSNIFDTVMIEDELDKIVQHDKNIWYGIKVVTYQAKQNLYNITNAELPGYLFIDENYKNSLGDKWKDIITVSYINTKLVPVVKQNVDPKFEKSLKIIGARFGDQKMHVYALYNKFRSMDIYFDIINEEEFFAVLQYLGIVQNALNNGERFGNVLNEMLRKLSSFRGNQTYGGSKNKLAFRKNPYDSPETDKERTFFYENCILTIRSIVEKSGGTTEISFWNVNTYSHIMEKVAKKPFFRRYNFHVFQICESYKDYLFVMSSSEKAFNKSKDIDVPDSAIRSVAKYFVNKINSLKFDNQIASNYIEVLNGKSIFHSDRTFVTFAKLGIELQEWIATASGFSEVPVIEPPEANPSRKIVMDSSESKEKAIVNLSSFISTLFVKNIREGDLLTYLKNVDSKTSQPLQIIEIAINEGTTKPFIEAVLTELTQNSIDAIREIGTGAPKIEVFLNKSQDNKTLYLTIKDYVGMSENGFLHIGIPFLSTKTPSELVTGEMGSGFFNAYRESKYVFIESHRDGIVRYSYDLPIKDRNDRVVDITKKIVIAPSKSKTNETKIVIAMDTPDIASQTDLISRVVYMIHNVISLSIIQFPILYNGRPISKNKVSCGSVGHFEILYCEEAKESYMLTKGIPFASLTPYMKEILMDQTAEVLMDQTAEVLMGSKILINVTHGGYTPVQTRTRINIPDSERENMKLAFRVACFVRFLYEFINVDNPGYLLDHVESRADPGQLYLAGGFLRLPILITSKDYLSYVSFYKQPTIAQLINDTMITLGRNATGSSGPENIKKFVSSKFKTLYPHIDDMVVRVVQRWFRDKKYPDDVEERKVVRYNNLKIPELKEILRSRGLKVSGTKPELIERLEGTKDKFMSPKKVIKEDIENEEMTKILNIWVRTTITEAQRIGIKGYTRPLPMCRAVFSEKTKHAKGWYNVLTNTLVINLIYIDKKDITDFVNKIKNKILTLDAINHLKKNKIWKDLFLLTFPCSTVIHELEHFRRGTKHEAVHEPTRESLWKGDDVSILPGGERTFDQSANAVYQKLLSEGFYGKLKF